MYSGQLWRTSKLILFMFPGLVSKQTSKVEEAGQHEERSRPTSPQCSSSDLLWRANPTRGDRTQGAAAEREEVDETGNPSDW